DAQEQHPGGPRPHGEVHVAGERPGAGGGREDRAGGAQGGAGEGRDECR
ncbi:unnamed protein product, partial [Heterosigma akashiwo]